MTLIITLFLAGLAGTLVAFAHQNSSSENEKAAVRQTIHYYFKGAADGDMESFRKAFHPKIRAHAAYLKISNTTAGETWSMENIRCRLATITSSRGRREM